MLSKGSNNRHGIGGDDEKKRFLITVSVVGSAGPMRFVVKEDDSVSAVIQTALRSYAREQRLPIMGTNSNHFLLYSANAASDPLNPVAQIGSQEVRSFKLCKKQRQLQRKPSELITQKGLGCLEVMAKYSLYFLRSVISFMKNRSSH